MSAATFDVGPNLVAILAPLASAAAAWIGTRKVRREMGNNGGSTLRDAVDRIERRLTGIEDRLTSVEASTSTEEP